MTASSPAALSAGALDAFVPVWTALMVAIGFPLAELGDVVLDDGFGGGVEVEGVGEGGQVSNARWCLRHEVVPVCQGSPWRP